MKIIRLGVAILSLAYVAHGATNEAYEITSYFPDKGIVGIKYGAVRTNRPFSSFSPAEQQQITDWLTDKGFESKLRVELEKVEQDGEVGRMGSHKIISYNITFENRSEVPLSGIKAEYRIFFEAGRCEIFGKTKALPWYTPGEFKFDLEASEARTFSTEEIHIRNGPGSGGRPVEGGHMALEYKAKFIGLHVNVSRTGRTGIRTERKFQDEAPPQEEWVQWRLLKNPGIFSGTSSDTF